MMIKSFIDLNSFKKKQLTEIFSLAQKIKKNPKKYDNLLKNKSLGLLFEKQSTRTRLSFSIGMKKLGGNVIELNHNQIGFGKRESIEDILKTMSQYLDVLMIRNDNHNQLQNLASLNILPIINGLSDLSHPCQILSDIFTIEEILGKIQSKKIVWLGDFNNVLISLIDAAEIFKFRLNILVPKTLRIKYKNKINFNNLKYSYFYDDFKKGIMNTDCVMTDVWVSMKEKKITNKKMILKKYQVNDDIMKLAKKNAIFMHCLPAHRNEEVTDSVIDGNNSVVWQQAQNRMYIQQALLYFLININE
jgi:ornithine carbamoyltransferase